MKFFIAVILLLSTPCHSQIGLNFVPQNNQGGTLVKYTVVITTTSNEMNPSTQSLRINLPSEYNMPVQSLTCLATSGFTNDGASLPCGVIEPNVIYVNFKTHSNPSTAYVFEIDSIKNPNIESGPFLIGLKQKNALTGGTSGDSDTLKTDNFSISATFEAPLLTSTTFSYTGDTVNTLSDLNLDIRPQFEITSGSKLIIKFPFRYSSEHYIDHLNTGFSCTGIALVNNGMSCSFSEVDRSLTFSNIFTSNVTPSQTAKLRILKVWTPLSTSQYGGLDVSITLGDGRVYQKMVDQKIKVNIPIQLTKLEIFNALLPLGSQVSISNSIEFNGPFLTNFRLKYITSAGLNLAASSISTQSSELTRSATELFVEVSNIQTSTVIVILNINTRIFAEDSSIKLEVYDSNNNIAQVSTVKAIQFRAGVITGAKVNFAPAILGSKGVATIKFVSQSEYPSGSVIKLTSPSQFGKGVVACTSNLDGNGNCAVSGDVITLNNAITAAKNGGFNVEFTASEITLPYCLNDYPFSIDVESSGGFAINEGSITLPQASLSMDTLVFQGLQPTSTSSGSPNTIVLDFMHTSVLQAASVIEIQLHPDIATSGTTTCGFQAGFSVGVSCSIASQTITIADGVQAQRQPRLNFKLTLSNIVNPRAKGNFNIKTTIKTGATSCVYAEGEASLEITTAQTMVYGSFLPKVSNSYVYTTYVVSLEPKTTVWYADDFLEIEIPNSLFISDNINCVKTSNNLQSITCQKLTATTIKVFLGVSSAQYAISKQLTFDLSYIQNPESSTPVGGITFYLKTKLGNVFESYSNIQVVYSGKIKPVNTVAFATEFKGFETEGKFSFKVNSFLPKGTIFSLEFEASKFDVSSTISIKESNPKMKQKTARRVRRRRRRMRILEKSISKLSSQDYWVKESSDYPLKASITSSTISTISSLSTFTSSSSSSHKIRELQNSGSFLAEFEEDIQELSQVALTLKMKSPTSNSVSGADIIFKITSNDQIIFQENGLLDTINFQCQIGCSTCELSHENCTSCQSPLIIKGSKCVNFEEGETQLIGYSLPFIFTIIAVIIILIFWVLDRCWKNRNFEWNFIYSILRINYFFALIGITFMYFINKDRFSPNYFGFMMIFFIFLHLVLSIFSGYAMLQKLKSRNFGGARLKGVPRVGNLHAELFIKKLRNGNLEEEEEKKCQVLTDQGKKRENSVLFKMAVCLSFIFNSQFLRMYYSSSSKEKTYALRKKISKEKAYFWCLDQYSFDTIKRHLIKHRLFYALFQVVLVIGCCFTLIGQKFLFKLDLVLLTFIDFIIFVLAFLELYPKIPKNKKVGPSDMQNRVKSYLGKESLDESSDNPLNATISNENREGAKVKLLEEETDKLNDKQLSERTGITQHDKNRKGEDENQVSEYCKNKVIFDPETNLHNKYGDQPGVRYVVSSSGDELPEEVLEILVSQGKAERVGGRVLINPKYSQKSKKVEDSLVGKTKAGQPIFLSEATGLLYTYGVDKQIAILNRSYNIVDADTVQFLESQGKITLNSKGNAMICENYETSQFETVWIKGENGVLKPKLVGGKISERDFFSENSKISDYLSNGVNNRDSSEQQKLENPKNIENSEIKSFSSNLEHGVTNLKKSRDLQDMNNVKDKWFYSKGDDHGTLEVIFEENEGEAPKIYQNEEEYQQYQEQLKLHQKRKQELKQEKRLRDGEYVEILESDEQGIFEVDGKRYKIDENGRLIDLKGDKVVPEGVAKKILEDKDISNVKNSQFLPFQTINPDSQTLQFDAKIKDNKNRGILRKIRDNGGTFIGGDNKVYKIDPEGNLIDSNGNKINPNKAEEILQEYQQQMIKNSIKNVSIVPNQEFIGKGGQKYWINPEGQLVDENGDPAPPNEEVRDKEGNILHVGGNGELLDSKGRKIELNKEFVDKEGNKYSLNENGELVNSEGQLVNKEIELVGKDGIKYSQNENGELVAIVDEDDDFMIKPDQEIEDSQGNVFKVNEQGELVDEKGNVLDPEKQKEVLNDYFNGVQDKQNQKMKEDFEVKKALERQHQMMRESNSSMRQAILVPEFNGFKGTDGNIYFFDKEGQMRDAKGNIVHIDDLPILIDNLSLNHVPNCPEHLKDPLLYSRKKPLESFIARDGGVYFFDKHHNLVDDQGNIIDRSQIRRLTDGIDLKNVKNVPGGVLVENQKTIKKSRNGTPYYNQDTMSDSYDDDDDEDGYKKYKRNRNRLDSLVNSFDPQLSDPKILGDESFDLQVDLEAMEDTEFHRLRNQKNKAKFEYSERNFKTKNHLDRKNRLNQESLNQERELDSILNSNISRNDSMLRTSPRKRLRGTSQSKKKHRKTFKKKTRLDTTGSKVQRLQKTISKTTVKPKFSFQKAFKRRQTYKKKTQNNMGRIGNGLKEIYIDNIERNKKKAIEDLQSSRATLHGLNYNQLLLHIIQFKIFYFLLFVVYSYKHKTNFFLQIPNQFLTLKQNYKDQKNLKI